MLETDAPGPRIRIEAAGDTDVGGRGHNEDAVLVRSDISLFLLADGAGGEDAGKVASVLATTTVADYMAETRFEALVKEPFDELGLPVDARRLSAAFHKANREVISIAKTSRRYHGMGTTLVGALVSVETGLVHVAHVGDSRCYRLRDGHIELLTNDHSLVNDVLELRPELSPEEARQLPSHVITRALGMSEKLRVSVRSHDLVPGDHFILSSDGLSDVVTQDQLGDAVALGGSPVEQVKLLIELAKDAGARDNLAAVVIWCAEANDGGSVLPHARPRRRSELAKNGGRIDDNAEILVISDDEEEEATNPRFHVISSDAMLSSDSAPTGHYRVAEEVMVEAEAGARRPWSFLGPRLCATCGEALSCPHCDRHETNTLPPPPNAEDEL